MPSTQVVRLRPGELFGACPQPGEGLSRRQLQHLESELCSQGTGQWQLALRVAEHLCVFCHWILVTRMPWVL